MDLLPGMSAVIMQHCSIALAALHCTYPSYVRLMACTGQDGETAQLPCVVPGFCLTSLDELKDRMHKSTWSVSHVVSNPVKHMLDNRRQLQGLIALA